MFDAFFNPRGFRPWLLAEERELALERQAEEHHRSEAEQNHPRPTAAHNCRKTRDA